MGDALWLKHTVNLREALCGFDFTFTHLDGRVVGLRSPVGMVVLPGRKMSVACEGFPRLGGKLKDCGNLYVVFDVNMSLAAPLSCAAVQSLIALLPAGDPPAAKDLQEVIDVHMHFILFPF